MLIEQKRFPFHPLLIAGPVTLVAGFISMTTLLHAVNSKDTQSNDYSISTSKPANAKSASVSTAPTNSDASEVNKESNDNSSSWQNSRNFNKNSSTQNTQSNSVQQSNSTPSVVNIPSPTPAVNEQIPVQPTEPITPPIPEEPQEEVPTTPESDNQNDTLLDNLLGNLVPMP